MSAYLNLHIAIAEFDNRADCALNEYGIMGLGDGQGHLGSDICVISISECNHWIFFSCGVDLFVVGG